MIVDEGARSDRLGLVLAVLLAAVGLVGAIVAWRVMDEGNAVGDASRDALVAARERSEAVLDAEGQVSQAHGAWLEYEMARRQAERLRAEGLTVDALRADKLAASHWAFVAPDYLSADGQYQADEQLDAIVADKASTADIDAGPHLTAAVDGEDRMRDLSIAGVLVAAALPFLTLAEVTGGRVRFAGAVLGSGVFAASLVVLALAWA